MEQMPWIDKFLGLGATQTQQKIGIEECDGSNAVVLQLLML